MIKTFIMLQNISISDKCCSSELCIHQRNQKKLYSAVFNIIIMIIIIIIIHFLFFEQQIRILECFQTLFWLLVYVCVYSLHRQAMKKTSRNRYPLRSKMLPAAMDMSARPRFCMDCILYNTSERYYRTNTCAEASGDAVRSDLQSIRGSQLMLRHHKRHHGPESTGQQRIRQT